MQQNSQRSVQSLFNAAVCTTEEVVCWVWLASLHENVGSGGVSLCWMDVRHLMRDVKRIFRRGRFIVLFGGVMVSRRLLGLA